MYNAYGSNVFKKYQVNMGNPYPVRSVRQSAVEEKIEPVEDVSQKNEEILEKARAQAEQIIQKANEEADEMLMAAQEKISAHMQEVEQQAKEEGYRNGENLARQHYQELIDEAKKLKREAQEMVENTVMGLEGKMVETILEIGRKVIGKELSENKDTILGLIRSTLLGSSPSGDIIITVCPEEFDFVHQNKEKLIEGIQNTRNITIKQDSSMEKGGCIVETDFGSVDGSIEIRLKAVEDAFRELLGYDLKTNETDVEKRLS